MDLLAGMVAALYQEDYGTRGQMEERRWVLFGKGVTLELGGAVLTWFLLSFLPETFPLPPSPHHPVVLVHLLPCSLSPLAHIMGAPFPFQSIL